MLRRRLISALKPAVERLPSLAALYRLTRDSRLHVGEPQMTPLGFRFIGNREMEMGRFELVERRLVERLLGVSDVLVNVGANIGYYCCIAAQHGTRAVAFEPMPANLFHLYRNLRANGWEQRVEVFPLALADRIGVVEMFGGGTGASLIPGWAGASKESSTLVPVSSLDRVLGHRFTGEQCLLIVDIEGAELSVLRGAEGFLERTPRPFWIMEISTTEHQPDGVVLNPHLLETFSAFWRRGYRSWVVGQHLRPVSSSDVSAVLENRPASLGGHNFLFVAAGSRDRLDGVLEFEDAPC